MDTLKDNPYKPGTSEFKEWEKGLIQAQLMDTVDRQVAISIADKRIAQLKLQLTPSQRTLALEDLINSLPKPGEVFTNFQLLVQEVNILWQETRLGPKWGGYLWLPQIVTGPNWTTKEQLYQILHHCVGVDIGMTKETELDWAIHRPLKGGIPNLQDVYKVEAMSFNIVRTTFLKFMLH